MRSSDNTISRRKLVGTLGAGLATVALPEATQAQTTSTAQPMVDPTSKYLKPPYTSAFQPWPGLASKMTPPPDHGETSYKGSGRLLNRKALITGGDSGMGRAAAIAYAREGADVAINYFPSEEPDAQQVAECIRQAGRKAVLILGISVKRPSVRSWWRGQCRSWADWTFSFECRSSTSDGVDS